MRTIGLTGNFGMGKTTVLNLFRESGLYTFNSDEYVHNILKNPVIVNKIAKVLGKDVLKASPTNISVNKNAVADIIFNDSQKRKAVEKIIHPGVLKEIQLTKSRIARTVPSAVIVFEVPLLFEAGYEKNFDKTVLVYCTRDTAFKRLAAKGFSRGEVLKRARAQMPVIHKKKLADYVIDNNNGIEKTRMQVRRFLKRCIL